MKHRILIRKCIMWRGEPRYMEYKELWMSYLRCPTGAYHRLVLVQGGHLFGNDGWIAQLLKESACPYCEGDRA